MDEEALCKALEEGKVKKYVTDFANPVVANAPNTLVTPHLGASTEESEDNCAVYGGSTGYGLSGKRKH